LCHRDHDANNMILTLSVELCYKIELLTSPM